jgi:hypothetical protein
MPEQTLDAHDTVQAGEEEDALEADPARPDLLRGDPFLDRLVAIDVVDARVAHVAGAEALDLDETVIDEEAAGETPDRGEPALAEVLGVRQRGHAHQRQGEDRPRETARAQPSDQRRHPLVRYA